MVEYLPKMYKAGESIPRTDTHTHPYETVRWRGSVSSEGLLEGALVFQADDLLLDWLLLPEM